MAKHGNNMHACMTQHCGSFLCQCTLYYVSNFQAGGQEEMGPSVAPKKSCFHNAPHFPVALCEGLTHNDSGNSSDTITTDNSVD